MELTTTSVSAETQPEIAQPLLDCLRIADNQPLASAWLGALDLLDARMKQPSWTPQNTNAVLSLLRSWGDTYKPRRALSVKRDGRGPIGHLMENPAATGADMLRAFSNLWTGPGSQGNFPLWLGAQFLDQYLTALPATAAKMRQMLEACAAANGLLPK